MYEVQEQVKIIVQRSQSGVKLGERGGTPTDREQGDPSRDSGHGGHRPDLGGALRGCARVKKVTRLWYELTILFPVGKGKNTYTTIFNKKK